MKKYIFCLFLVFMTVLTGCSSAQLSADKETTVLSFKSASSYEFLKTLNGKTVSINGYLATSSPVDGSFIFLMNLPYQSCPFCKPNTSQLSNTMEVYPKKGEKFSYTNQAVRVTGTLTVAADPSKSFTDQYGYEFNFKIVDAEYTIIKAEELSPELAVWQKIAQSDVISEIYSMHDYLHFLCAWPTYFCDSYTDANGNFYPGFFLYASDALNFITQDGAQYNYGYREGYFDGIISRIKACDRTAFSSLITNVEQAKALAARALAELQNGNFTYELQYVEQFDTQDYIYTLNNGAELVALSDELYYSFTDWLGNWEM